MKTFTELNEEHLRNIFTEFKSAGYLVSYVTDGTPNAISGYLQRKMLDTLEETVSLPICNKDGTLMTFKLSVSRRGDSIAFVPEFEIGNVGLDYIESDSLSFDGDALDSMAIELIKNKEFIDALRFAYMGKVFRNEDWVTPESGAKNHGLKFTDEDDLGICAASVFYTIFEVLCNNKEVANEITYDVDGLGQFKVTPAKNGYNVALVYDKGFKLSCKNDVLAERVASK